MSRRARQFGRVAYRPASGPERAGWEIAANPDVAIRLKRLFPRAEDSRQGLLTLTDTPEVCRDLDWALQRWPMAMSDADRRRLKRGAAGHRATEQTVLRLLEGDHQPLESQLELGLTPRPYQLVAADMLLHTGRLLLGDDLGLGKTIASLLALRGKDALPALVVGPTHLPTQWLKELHHTFPGLVGHILTKTTPYDFAEVRELEGQQPDVIITSYSKLAGWAGHLAGKVNTVLYDEVQELRRPDSQKYRAAGRIADGARYRAGLSATPVYNYIDELHSIISILDPEALGEKHEFAREWGHTDHRGRIHATDPAALGTWLRSQGLFLRRTRAEVGRELPPRIVVPHTVDLDEAVLHRLEDDAASLAELIVERQGTTQDRFRASGELDSRLRHATGVAKAPYVAAFVRMLLESEDKLVLFGWHHDVYDIWRNQLADLRPVFYTGEETPSQKEAAKQAFVDGDSRLLVMSLRAGTGLDGLQNVCNVCVIGELDWSPGVHDQNLGRLDRDRAEGIEPQPVVAYVLVAEDGSDPVVAEVNGLKRQQSDPIRDPDAKRIEPVVVDDQDRIRRLAEAVLAKHRGKRRPRAA